MPSFLSRPGMRTGSYPEKPAPDLTDFEQAAHKFFVRILGRFTSKSFNQEKVIRRIEQHESTIRHCTEEVLSVAILKIREKLITESLSGESIAEAFAIIREVSARTLGKRHYDVQLFGAWLMIHGNLAEMSTGEGKTLTTSLAASTAALAGIPVHVITANDYLAGRDAELMQPLYRRLGLTGTAVIEGMDKVQRQKAYQSDIVHTTNKQIAFDYLRDRLEIGGDSGPLKFLLKQCQPKKVDDNRLILRGLNFALVDEADSVLIDEANTPLIITRTKPNKEPASTYSDALYLASTLVEDRDYVVANKTRQVELTQQGEDKLAENVRHLSEFWRQTRQREALVKKALIAQFFYINGKQYIVQDGKVRIIDEFTGRLMPDRSWEQGLHQMIEAKEGCLITEQRETLARISYQTFFRRYLHLAGTSGTIKEVATELHNVYGLSTIQVPTHKPSQMKSMPERIFLDYPKKKQALLARIAQLYEQGRPVLIGTGSVAESEEVSRWLQAGKFPHQVLNATQDKYEADIIAKAGRQKSITVATNMAGRGTDIALGLGVAELGGLHVIALNSNESRRVDRQLYGRCARQGDPGSTEAILCLQDPAFTHFYAPAFLKLLALLCPNGKPIPRLISHPILRIAQHVKEGRQRRLRKWVMAQDKQTERQLAFTGKFE